jgi:hypothetical protein
LSGQFSTGDTILVDVDQDKNSLVFRPISQGIPAPEVRTVDAS